MHARQFTTLWITLVWFISVAVVQCRGGDETVVPTGTEQTLREHALRMITDITGEPLDSKTEVVLERGCVSTSTMLAERFPVWTVKYGNNIRCVLDEDKNLRWFESAVPPASMDLTDTARVAEEFRQRVFQDYVALSKPIISRGGHTASFVKTVNGLSLSDEYLKIEFGDDYRVVLICNWILQPKKETVLHPRITVNEALEKMRAVAAKLPSSPLWKQRYLPKTPSSQLVRPELVTLRQVRPNNFLAAMAHGSDISDKLDGAKRWIYECVVEFRFDAEYKEGGATRKGVFSYKAGVWIDIETGQVVGGYF